MSEKKLKMFNARNIKYIALLYFVLYFIIGLFCFKDYGIAVSDESLQRRHSLVAYKYINKVVFDRDVYELRNYAELDDYTSKYYGTAIQIPLVFIEDLTDFSMTSRNIYLMRHAYTFLICFIGYIFFYFALRKIFKDNDFIPLIGVILISLYPRFFSIQFVDIKNMAFAGLNMITIYFLVLAVEKRSISSLVLFGVAAAFATNCRMMAVIYPVVIIGYFLLDDITNVIEIKKGISEVQYYGNRLKKYILPAFSYIVSWIVISPFAWSNPIDGFINCFNKFASFDNWKGTMVFMGKLIHCEEMPWYYLLVWFAISIPILYLALFVIEHVHLVIDVCKAENPWKQLIVEDKWEACSLLLFWGSVGAVILLHSRIYIGWHHMYYVFVPFCIAASFGLKVILNRLNIRIVIATVGALLIVQGAWIVYNHPYEPSYFNIIGKVFGDQFDREEWRTSAYPALKWILENEDGTLSVSGDTHSIALLTKEEKARIISEDDSQYIINSYRSVIGNDINYEGYDEVYTIWVDGYKVCSVFKRID